MTQVVGRALSSRGDGTEYVLMATEGGGIVCSCVGFGYRRRCRHVTEWKARHPQVPGVRERALRVEEAVPALELTDRECAFAKDGKHQFWRRQGVILCWWCRKEKELCR